MTTPHAIQALIAKWRERVRQLNDKGTRMHYTRASEAQQCADELEAALAHLASAPPASPCLPDEQFSEACNLASSVHVTRDGVERCDLCGCPAAPPASPQETGERDRLSSEHAEMQWAIENVHTLARRGLRTEKPEKRAEFFGHILRICDQQSPKPLGGSVLRASPQETGWQFTREELVHAASRIDCGDHLWGNYPDMEKCKYCRAAAMLRDAANHAPSQTKG